MCLLTPHCLILVFFLSYSFLRTQNTLLDYCTRGNVEHLIRMRERLDEHSRYLEAQLAGLEALVEEKGEIDVVVPRLPERTQDTKPQSSQGKGNN